MWTWVMDTLYKKLREISMDVIMCFLHKEKIKWQRRNCRVHVFEHVIRLEFCEGRSKLNLNLWDTYVSFCSTLVFFFFWNTHFGLFLTLLHSKFFLSRLHFIDKFKTNIQALDTKPAKKSRRLSEYNSKNTNL